MDCYSAFSSLQAYFLPTHGNGEDPVLGKLSYLLILFIIVNEMYLLVIKGIVLPPLFAEFLCCLEPLYGALGQTYSHASTR
jgi:hypothetical protein